MLHLPFLFFDIHEADSFRFSQTMYSAMEFKLHGIDLRTPVPIFGASSYIPFEFPLYQIITALISRYSQMEIVVAGRLVALVFFLAASFIAFRLAQRWFNHTVALSVLFLFNFLPFGFRYAHSPLMEFLAVFFFLSALLLFQKFIEVKHQNSFSLNIVLVGTFFLTVCLSFLVKITTAIVLLPLFLLFVPQLMVRRRLDWSALLIIGVSLTLSFSSYFFWNRFADRVKSDNVFTQRLISTSPEMLRWNFGTWEDRVDLLTWRIILIDFTGPVAGGFAALLIAFLIFCKTAPKGVVFCSSGSILVALLFLTPLYRSHQYYFAAIYFVIVLILAFGIFTISVSLRSKTDMPRSPLPVFLVFIVLVSWTTPPGAKILADLIPQSEPPIVEVLRDETHPNSLVMFLGCDWNPELPFSAGRKALMVPAWGIDPLESDLSRVDFIVSCSDDNNEIFSEIENFFPAANFHRVKPNLFRVIQTPSLR
jgi:hypothetical protein